MKEARIDLGKIVAALAVAISGLSLIKGAAAQEASAPERQSVMERARPDYDPLGAPIASFLVFPSLDFNQSYNSNVFATEGDEKGDFLSVLSPGVQVRSNWNNNALNFGMSGQINRYAKQVGEDNSNFHAATDGRIDILRGIYVTSGLSYDLQHESRASPNTAANEKNPTEYQVAGGTMSFVHDTGRLALQIDSDVNDYSYNNAVTSTGTVIAETGRNRVEYSIAPKLLYEIVPGYHATLRTRFNWRDYMSQFDSSGYDRTSHGYEIDAGTAVSLADELTGDIFAGYFKQVYKDPRLAPASGPSFGGDLLWNVTPLMSLRSSLVRTIEETTVPPASTFVQTAFSLSAEREVRRNVLATIGGNYIVQDFQGLTRTDRNFGANLGARYLINRNLNAGLSLSYSRRFSNAADLEYTDYVISADIRLQY